MSPEKKDPFEQLLKDHLSAPLSQPVEESCPDENWMAAYLEGSQSEYLKRTFERHLLQCDRCQAEMALLLKTGVMEAQPKPAAVPAQSSPRINLLTFLFDWTKATAFRPVFAILLVSAVTGVIGYRLLRDERIVKERPVDMAESAASRNGSPTAVAPESPPPAQPSSEQSQDLKAISSSVRRETARDERVAPGPSQAQTDELRSRGKTNGQDQELKDAFAAEPPSNVPAESNRLADGGRRDMPVASQTSPEPLRKESLSASAVDRQNSQSQTRADEASAKPKNQVMPVAAPAPTRQALGALSAGKVEQDKLANTEESGTTGTLEKKKQVFAEAERRTVVSAANEGSTVKRIEAGGKRFELSEGVWKDSSILPDDPTPTLVNVNSPDFDRHRKEFAPYELVLSRPQDVLIKLDSRVYRIRKAR